MEDRILHAHPNPARDYIIIKYNTKAIGLMQLQIFDANGSLVYRKEVSGEDALRLDTRSYKTGLYIIQLIEGKTVVSSEKVNIIH
ncbi:MAG: T9SS type A sorting domain-containing protein [Hyphomicrobiales bacterium]